MGDESSQLKNVLSVTDSGSFASVVYKKCHHLLAEGNFVLSVCEGYVKQMHSSFFDLYRVKDGKIVEHWDTTETIPPRSEWKNNNGKF
jgi:predicted SnoaL-like aldol condensation-catalyzing enzyme